MSTTALPFSMIPGDSFLHRLNPLAKIVWIVGYLVIAFSTRNPFLLYGMAVFAFLLVIGSGLLRRVGKALFVLLPIGSSLIFLQAVTPPTSAFGLEVIGSLGPFTIYQGGIYNGLVLLGRVVSVLIVSLAIVMTTHPSDLFTSLARLRVPYTFNFMVAMTLQLIPVLQREFGIILSAQKSRAMRARGFGAVLPSFVPVFVGAIERVQQLSISLESRAFGSAGQRTSYRQVTVRPIDWAVGVLGAVATIGGLVVIVLNGRLDMSQSVVFPAAFALTLVSVAAIVFLSLISFTLVLMFRR
ncbi:energy-coupling factor transporter transmembrane component T family protein [Actinopolymorpha alba]|uniref:energy-coupling factor transporter transmembrane component T family protein n=1 Tax=Actinopolymorpha alba TaxID=533267 RepID=UPI000367BF95|nr:energy-coupling factor transporter transmembrane component T [Actinopolymorpha alba]